jgi:hypothetical protein
VLAITMYICICIYTHTYTYAYIYKCVCRGQEAPAKVLLSLLALPVEKYTYWHLRTSEGTKLPRRYSLYYLLYEYKSKNIDS